MGDFVFFVIYVYNDYKDRIRFWDFFVLISVGGNEFWFIVGDFNVVFKDEDRFSKLGFNLVDIN